MNLPLIFTVSVYHFKTMQQILMKVLFVPVLDTLKHPFWKFPCIFNSKHSDCGLIIQNLVSWKLPKNVRFPYFRGEGGGPEKYKNFLIFYFLIRGRREGVKVNKDIFIIYALFYGFPWMTNKIKGSRKKLHILRTLS